jgi:hypothetical protein
VVGLITLLLALVLGLLIWTAFSVFTTQQAEAQSLGPMILELDLALEKYGPETSAGREHLREGLVRSRERFFGDKIHGPRAFTYEESRANMRGLADYLTGFARRPTRKSNIWRPRGNWRSPWRKRKT